MGEVSQTSLRATVFVGKMIEDVLAPTWGGVLRVAASPADPPIAVGVEVDVLL